MRIEQHQASASSRMNGCCHTSVDKKTAAPCNPVHTASHVSNRQTRGFQCMQKLRSCLVTPLLIDFELRLMRQCQWAKASCMTDCSQRRQGVLLPFGNLKRGPVKVVLKCTKLHHPCSHPSMLHGNAKEQRHILTYHASPFYHTCRCMSEALQCLAVAFSLCDKEMHKYARLVSRSQAGCSPMKLR